MAEDDPPPQPGSPAPDTPADAIVRRRRRWPWVIGIFLLILAGLVFLLPVLVRSPPGRGLIVAQISGRLDGHIELRNLSLGWFSGLRVDGLVVFDASGRQVLQIAHFDSELSLWRWMRGHYAVGQTHLDQLDVLLSREADGSLNWEHLLHRATAGSAGVDVEPDFPWTNFVVGAQLDVNHGSLTYEDRGSGRPDFVRHAHGQVIIASDRRSIALNLAGDIQIGSNAPAAISIDCSAHLPKGVTIAPGASPYSIIQSLDGNVHLWTDRFIDPDLGIILTSVNLPVGFRKGIGHVGASGPPGRLELPPSLLCNGGVVHLTGVTMDFRGPSILIAMPDHLKLMRGVALNPAFASWTLGGMLKNPLFVRTVRADGRLNVTVNGEKSKAKPSPPKKLIIPLTELIDDAHAAMQPSR